MSKENKTLFIRNLPFSTSKENLEDTFSDYGPIKQCFIVTDRGKMAEIKKSLVFVTCATVVLPQNVVSLLRCHTLAK